jgi:hypothetical protein
MADFLRIEGFPSSWWERRRAELAAVLREGAVAGVLGAAAVAVWFFCIDWSNGRPLYTPTVLGMALFRRSALLENPGMIDPSLTMTQMFTLVHGVIFALMGMATSRLLYHFERSRNVLVSIVLLAVALEFFFLAVALTTAAPAMEALGWREVLLGNLLASVSMVTYLWRRHPGLHPRQ